MSDFSRRLAVVIGINQYTNGIVPLGNAVNDAHQIHNIFQQQHNYETHLLLDADATKAQITELLTKTLPKQVKEDECLLFYFAGHGIALDGDDGPQGYLIPQDAVAGNSSSYLPMNQVHDWLTALPCRHFLTILDCCFAGAFRWSTTRDFATAPEEIYLEHYHRFIEHPAWQVITSASYDETALDALSSLQKDTRSKNGNHSPFAAALIDALKGAADTSPPAQNGKPAGDGVITATELYSYLRDRVETATIEREKRQTPGLWHLKNHDRGEYIFLTPGHELNLKNAPPLDESTNPYRGLESFREKDTQLFFGRTTLVEKLYDFVESNYLTVVLGASGSGKSSLVRAGLIPELRKNQPSWRILNPIRPGESPFPELNNALKQAKLPEVEPINTTSAQSGNNLNQSMKIWKTKNPGSKLLLLIDQSEELITLCKDESERQAFVSQLLDAMTNHSDELRVVITVRSDFEPQLRDLFLKSRPKLEDTWQTARFIVPQMTRAELRSVIEKPAEAKVMYFEPYDLVEQLIDEVADMPGGLPLLSFALSELYLKYLQRQTEAKNQGKILDRSITEADYEEIGGVTQSLTQRADQEYKALVNRDSGYAKIISHVMLRMVALGGGELTRRRVPLVELEYPPEKKGLVKEVIKGFTAARLLVTGEDGDGNSYVEPAHDALVRGWQKLLEWKQEDEEGLLLQRRLTPVAQEWNSQQQARFLWHNNPRLDLLKKVSKSDDNWLNQVEAEFVQRSVGRKSFNTRRNWSVAIAVILGLGAGLVFSLIGQRDALIGQIQASRQAAEASLISKQNLEALIGSLRAAKTLQSEWLFKLLKPNTELQNQVKGTLQEAFYQVREQNRLDIKTLEKKTSDVPQTINFSRDGKLVVTFFNSSNSSNRDTYWDLESQKELPEFNKQELVSRIKVSEKDRENIIQYLEKEGDSSGESDIQKLKENITSSSELDKIFLSPNGDILAFYGVGNKNSNLEIWDLARQKIIFDRFVGYPFFSGVAWSHDGKKMATVDFDGIVHVWNFSNKSFYDFPIPQESFSFGRIVSFSPDGKRLAVKLNDETTTIKLWDLENNKELPSLHTDEKSITAITFSSNGELLAIAGKEILVVWDLDNRQRLASLRDSKIFPGSKFIKFVPNSDLLAFAYGGKIEFWNWKEQEQINNADFIELREDHIEKAFFGRGLNRQLLAFKNYQGYSAGIWDLENNQELHNFGKKKGEQTGQETYRSFSFSPDKKILALTISGKLRLFDLDKKEYLPTVFPGCGIIGEVKFSLDGKILATNGDVANGIEKDQVCLWDLSGNQLGKFETPDSVKAFAISPNGTLATVYDNHVKLWKFDESLNELMIRGCNWVRDYLENNPNVEESDRRLCDGVPELKQVPSPISTIPSPNPSTLSNHSTSIYTGNNYSITITGIGKNASYKGCDRKNQCIEIARASDYQDGRYVWKNGNYQYKMSPLDNSNYQLEVIDPNGKVILNVSVRPNP